MRKSTGCLRETFGIIRFSSFMPLNFNFTCLGKKQKRDMMIQDGPPDISGNIQFTA